MKKFLLILVIGSFILSGIGAGAVQSFNIKPVLGSATYQEPSISSSPKDYTHTVLVEVGTATWCPSCPASNAAWHSIYAGGNYNFEYTELVDDKNTDAHNRFYEFNPAWVPTSYWDGGMFVYPGTNQATFIANLNSAGARVVPDLVATLSAIWLGGTQMQISYNVQNNEATNYPGKIRIYVQELESRWNDYSGNPYHHALIDMAKKMVIDIPASDAISDTFTWDGTAAGYPDVTQDNLQIILAVFDDTPHTAYSDPPSGNPFNAYYSDECIAAIPVLNNPPGAPSINGPTKGTPNVKYNYTLNAVDPEGDDVYYYIDWGDTTNSGWVGSSASGVDVIQSHTWAKKGTYTVKAKAKDVNNGESDWTTLSISVPRVISINDLFLQFLQNHPHAFPILRHLMGL